jgi:hypothetical protein
LVSIRRTDHSALRVVRGGLLAVSSAVLAVSAHTLADGSLPDLPMTVLLTVMVGWTATALAAKARGPMSTIAILGAAQIVMHVVLTTLALHSNAHAETHAVTSGAMSGLTMTATHTFATILTALLVTRADAMLLTVLNAMRLLLPPVWRAAPVPDTVLAPIPVPAPEIGQLVSELFRSTLGRRGPPVHS